MNRQIKINGGAIFMDCPAQEHPPAFYFDIVLIDFPGIACLAEVWADFPAMNRFAIEYGERLIFRLKLQKNPNWLE